MCHRTVHIRTTLSDQSRRPCCLCKRLPVPHSLCRSPQAAAVCAKTAGLLQPKLLDRQQACCCSCTHLACRQDCNWKQVPHQRLSACRYLGATYDGSSSGKHGVVTGADVPHLAYESFPLCMLVSETHKYVNEHMGRLCRGCVGQGDDVTSQGAEGPSVMRHG